MKLMLGRCHMFYDYRVVDIPDNLPKWAGMSGSSELMGDSPVEMIEKQNRQKEERK
jgi:hypothetical protein